MPWLLTDPNDAECLDYSLQCYGPMRVPLVNNNTSHVQVANILKVVWRTQNTIEKQLWQDQIDKVIQSTHESQSTKGCRSQKDSG